MKIGKRSTAAAAVALLASAALAACGDAPEEGSDEGGATSDFLPCIVSDAGGFDDKSFNQLSYEGVQQAAEELGSEYNEVESNSENDYGPNLEAMVAAGCDAIITVGFALSAATVESATANPDIDYILIDDAADNDFDGTKDAENIKPILYNTAEAAFLAGYAAADFTTTGVVGTYGGQPFPTVTIFMDGFKQGAEYYAQEKGKDIRVVGFEGGDKGVFTGSFKADQTATNAAKQLLDQNADVLLPVGGPIYEGALTAIPDAGKDAVMIGTDADVFETDPRTQDLVLTSVLKNMKVSTYEAVLSSGNDEFDPEAYVGTLENEGVGIAPFHNFEGEVSDSLPGELDELRQAIIDGDVEVTSYLSE